jgi:deoxyhypusine synthase
MAGRKHFLGGKNIDPPPIGPGMTLVDLVDQTFNAYNAARFREACHLSTDRMLADDVVVGVSLSGAMTPAGLGMAAIVPMIQAGFIDWIVSTGANLYHDMHFGIGLQMRRGSPHLDDRELRREGVVRIYDILFDYNVLVETDNFVKQVVSDPEFDRTMSSAEFHYRLGRYVLERERVLGIRNKSLMAAAHEHAVPVYTSSPGDSSIGMNVAANALIGGKLLIDVNRDVNETAAIVYDAKQDGLKSATLLIGGGSPKNFVLQTEPQIQEVLGLEERGHDYYLQFTDARPDTGGLSGATPAEAVSWGKVDPDRLPDAVVCYLDSTIAVPMLAAYAMTRRPPRAHRRLYERREPMLERLRSMFKKRWNDASDPREIETP